MCNFRNLGFSWQIAFSSSGTTRSCRSSTLMKIWKVRPEMSLLATFNSFGGLYQNIVYMDAEFFSATAALKSRSIRSRNGNNPVPPAIMATSPEETASKHNPRPLGPRMFTTVPSELYSFFRERSFSIVILNQQRQSTFLIFDVHTRCVVIIYDELFCSGFELCHSWEVRLQ